MQARVTQTRRGQARAAWIIFGVRMDVKWESTQRPPLLPPGVIPPVGRRKTVARVEKCAVGCADRINSVAVPVTLRRRKRRRRRSDFVRGLQATGAMAVCFREPAHFQFVVSLFLGGVRFECFRMLDDIGVYQHIQDFGAFVVSRIQCVEKFIVLAG